MAILSPVSSTTDSNAIGECQSAPTTSSFPATSAGRVALTFDGNRPLHLMATTLLPLPLHPHLVDHLSQGGEGRGEGIDQMKIIL